MRKLSDFRLFSFFIFNFPGVAMHEKVIMAGFGGQGLLFMGKLVAQISMDQGRHVTYFPSYGAEVRGGTANCHVVISDDDIHSPIVEQASSLIIMNALSYTKFAPLLEPDGLMLLNTSIVQDYQPSACRGRIVPINASDEANAMGNLRIGNMVMMGAYIEARKLMSMDEVVDGLKRSLSTKRPEMVEINLAAVRRGREIMRRKIDGGVMAV